MLIGARIFSGLRGGKGIGLIGCNLPIGTPERVGGVCAAFVVGGNGSFVFGFLASKLGLPRRLLLVRYSGLTFVFLLLLKKTLLLFFLLLLLSRLLLVALVKINQTAPQRAQTARERTAAAKQCAAHCGAERVSAIVGHRVDRSRHRIGSTRG